jgi:dienelactone hydrolase
MIIKFTTLALLLIPIGVSAQERTESYMGSLAPVMRSIQQDNGFRMDYFHRQGLPLSEWRSRGRAEVLRTLSYSPPPVPLDIKVQSTIRREGYEVRTISFAGSPYYRIPAFLLVPLKGKPPYPGIVALHDHGGYFFHGKEKLVQTENEHPALTKFKAEAYGGRSYADELAKRGFVVLVIDAFYWGERRLQYDDPPPDLRAALKDYRPEQVEYVDAMNNWLGLRRHDMISSLFLVGATWLGIMNYDDRRSVDLLVSLPEVDPHRIGCVGLSIGGMRSGYLAGMDSRIRAAIITGWMTSLPTDLDITHSVVAGLPDAPGLHASLDQPDVATLAAPQCAIFVQNCGRDLLFTHAGMQQAADKIARVYQDLGHPERFRMRFYDVPHQFNVKMQEEAFEWLEKWLDGSAR